MATRTVWVYGGPYDGMAVEIDSPADHVVLPVPAVPACLVSRQEPLLSTELLFVRLPIYRRRAWWHLRSEPSDTP